MVRLITGLVLLACALAAQACTYCECEFADGSHCCVYASPAGNVDCGATCPTQGRAGVTCGSTNYQCTNYFAALERTECDATP